MKLRWNDMELEGTAEEMKEFVAAQRLSNRSADRDCLTRAGKPVKITFGEGQEVICRSIEESRRFLSARGLNVANGTISQNITKNGVYRLGRYEIRPEG